LISVGRVLVRMMRVAKLGLGLRFKLDYEGIEMKLVMGCGGWIGLDLEIG
jgi:hypothetical protein